MYISISSFIEDLKENGLIKKKKGDDDSGIGRFKQIFTFGGII